MNNRESKFFLVEDIIFIEVRVYREVGCDGEGFDIVLGIVFIIYFLMLMFYSWCRW